LVRNQNTTIVLLPGCKNFQCGILISIVLVSPLTFGVTCTWIWMTIRLVRNGFLQNEITILLSYQLLLVIRSKWREPVLPLYLSFSNCH